MTLKKLATFADRTAARVIRHIPSHQMDFQPDVPIVSFTMDDIPVSAHSNGARLLEEEGLLGTFYVAGGLSEAPSGIFADRERCIDLVQRGHEVACHTFSHPKLRGMSRARLSADLEKNKEWLDGFDKTEHRRNFAVPYGAMSAWNQSLLRKKFRTSRSVRPGINRKSSNLHYLLGVELRPDETFLTKAQAMLDDVLKNPGWLIFFTHDVSDDPSFYGCPMGAFKQLIVEAKAGGAKIMTVDAAADYLNVPR